MGLAPLKQPNWIKAHLKRHRFWQETQQEDLLELRQRLSIFKQANPEVSIVVPAYNEEFYLPGMLSSLAELKLPHIYPTELWVINDASTDHTTQLLEFLDVSSFRLPTNSRPKGARQKGLELAKGKYLIQADADTLYPPEWGLEFVEQLQNPETAIVYGPHAFYSHVGTTRLTFAMHENVGAVLYALRRKKRPWLNVFGFNSAFRRENALEFGSYEHTPTGSEDGHMALMLMNIGRIHYQKGSQNMAWTSDRRIVADGGMAQAFLKRASREGSRLWEYLSPPW